MEDSNILVFHGPRGGGKSGSMSVEAVIDMVKGRQVWSLMPIKANIEDHIYQSEMIDYDDLLRQDERYRNGVICWDETALWAYSRSWQSYFNKTLALVLTLIRKLDLSLYMTVQFLSLLDKNVRLQMDALIMCTDLSYKYSHLQRGSTIGQLLQDISGRFTGETYEYSQQIYQRTLHLRPFWGCWDSKALFDVEAATEKRTREDIYGVYEQQDNYTPDEADLIMLRHTIADFLEAQGKQTVYPTEFWRAARNMGFRRDKRKGEDLLSDLGVEIGGDWHRPIYKLNTVRFEMAGALR